MPASPTDPVLQAVEEIYLRESRRVFATLIRLLGDFELAEEAMHDAFTSAVESWKQTGIPENPRAWLVSTGRFKSIDSIRRRARFDASMAKMAQQLDSTTAEVEIDDEGVADDQLRLIFTCCHPAISPESQIALTLREVCGLHTEEIARAFLTSPATIAQRIVRGKAKIRNARIPYEIPGRKDLPERLESVLSVIYLVFNEAYSASFGDSVTREELSREAIRLARLLMELMPDLEVQGLLALLLLQESRRAARTAPNQDIILLEDQDRTLWNRSMIAEGVLLVDRIFAAGKPVGSYCIQAAIAAVHAQADHPGQTDWRRIVNLYDALLVAEPNPVVGLNRAVAVAMRDGPKSGLELIDQILERGELTQFHLAHAARADMCRRLGDFVAARQSFQRALDLSQQEPERRFLMKRIEEVTAASAGAH